MGIKNLLRILKPITKQRHIREFGKMKIAIDGYVWLHKAIFSMIDIILENPNSTSYLEYLNKRIDQFLSFKIQLIIVFDGNKLPMKENEENERDKHRQALVKESQDLLKMSNIEKAKIMKIRSIDINPQMAYQFIQLLKKKKIEYFVAPYEADAQLAYLSKVNLVDGVMTEDSDLLAYGCKRVLLKFNINTATCEEILYENIKKIPQFKYDFSSFDEDKFLWLCILTGCDFFKIKGVGIRTAYLALKDSVTYQEAFQSLKKKFSMPDDAEKSFEKAFLTFKFQVVYCPIENRMKYLNDMNFLKYQCMNTISDYSFLGEISDNEITQKIAFGEIDPMTHKPFHSSQSNISNKKVKRSGSHRNGNKSIKEIEKTQTRLSFALFKPEKSKEDIAPNNIIKGNDDSTKEIIVAKASIEMKKGNQIVKENKKILFPKRKYDDYIIKKCSDNFNNKSNNCTQKSTKMNFRITKNKTTTHKQDVINKAIGQCQLKTSILNAFNNCLKSTSIDYNDDTIKTASIEKQNRNSDNNTILNDNIDDIQNHNMINVLHKYKSAIIKPIKPSSKSTIQMEHYNYSPIINNNTQNNNKESFCTQLQSPGDTNRKIDYSFYPTTSLIKSIMNSTPVQDNYSQLNPIPLNREKLFNDYSCKMDNFQPFI